MHYTRQSTDNRTDAPVQTKGIYLCVIACVVGVFWHPASAKRATKTHKQKTQNKPLNAPQAKRTPPRFLGSTKADYPTSKFFLIFFVLSVLGVFFLNFFLILFYMLNFVKLCFIVYEVCIFVVFLSMICYG